jgi:hypothetical protein
MHSRESVLQLHPQSLRVRSASTMMPCSACGKRIAAGDEFLRLYGEAFHADCAFYSLRSRAEQRGRLH